MVPNPFRLLGRLLPGGGSGNEPDRAGDEDPYDRSYEDQSGGFDAEGTEARDEEAPRAEDEEFDWPAAETRASESPAAETRASEPSDDSGEADDPRAEEGEAEETPDEDPQHEEQAEEPAGDAEEGEDRVPAGVGAEDDSRSGGDSGEIDASGIPAPSIGPKTKITREDPEDRLARHEQSDVDAMGLDKRREVVGGSYSPSFAKQATLYGAFVLVVALIVVGALVAVNEFDQPPEQESNEAPWRDSTNPAKPSELDFPPDTAPEQVPAQPDTTDQGDSEDATT